MKIDGVILTAAQNVMALMNEMRSNLVANTVADGTSITYNNDNSQYEITDIHYDNADLITADAAAYAPNTAFDIANPNLGTSEQNNFTMTFDVGYTIDGTAQDASTTGNKVEISYRRLNFKDALRVFFGDANVTASTDADHDNRAVYTVAITIPAGDDVPANIYDYLDDINYPYTKYMNKNRDNHHIAYSASDHPELRLLFSDFTTDALIYIDFNITQAS